VTDMIVECGRFDYSKLDPQVAGAARAAAAEIHRLWKNTTDNIIRTGDALRSIKDQLDHGEFGAWIAAEFVFCIRTAQRFMQAAEWAEDKSEIVSYLEPVSIYLLAAPSTPPEAEKEVLEKLTGGEPLAHSKITAIVNEAKYRAKRAEEEAKRAEEEAKRTPRQRRASARREKEAADQNAKSLAKEIGKIAGGMVALRFFALELKATTCHGSSSFIRKPVTSM
jgi:hypothetical protein